MKTELQHARRHAGRRLGFEIHATVFLVYALATLAAFLALTARPVWLFWPLAGWAIGLAIHYLAIGQFFARRLDSLTQAEVLRRQGETQ